MDLRIKGKWALVTGGANGIGEEISCQLAQEGVNLVVTSRTRAPIDQLAQKLSSLPVSVIGVEVDFLHPDWYPGFAEQIKDIPIEILVNNAGHNLKVTDPYCSIEDWNRVLSLNFLTPVRICNLLIPKMKSSGWGRIVNITSCAGLENMGPVTYGVAKSSLTVYTRTMGRILATEGGAVVMTAVFPGVVVTQGGHWDLVLKESPSRATQYLKDRCPLGRFGKPDEIAPVVLFYCSELASFSHGAIIPVDAGQSRNYMYFNYLD
ncbi:MAG: SDR family oxidoreductase [Magnetococcales bacterium]|nr:SDR family oxidoreductase [Magnetococcales bacterium]